MIKRILISLFFVTAWIAMSDSCFAQDVYNFYFQKAKGPATVIQGGPDGKGQTVKSTDDDDAADMQALEDKVNGDGKPSRDKSKMLAGTSSATAVEAEKPLKHWAVLFGLGLVSNANPPSYSSPYMSYSTANGREENGRFAMGVEYSFNKYFGMEGEALAHFSDSSVYGDSSHFDGAIGAMVTPFDLRLFGYNVLDVSILAGGMSHKKMYYETETYSMTDASGNPTGDYAISVKNKSAFAAYAGLRLALNMGNSFSMILKGRVIPDSNDTDIQASGTLAYRF